MVGVYKSCIRPSNTKKRAIPMLQTKDKRYLKQLQSKSTFSHPCSKFLATAKVGLAHYDSFRGGGSRI